MGRFRAARVKSGGKGVLCTQSYLSVHGRAEDEVMLDSACLVYNSNFALYWLYMTNHWLASFVAKATVGDLLLLPLPKLKARKLESLDDFDYGAVDDLVRQSLGLEETDWALISDFFTYTLPGFKRMPDAPGPKPTRRDECDELERYCGFFLRVLGAAFGQDRFAATIFREDGAERLSVRLVAIHLKPVGADPIRCEAISSPALAQRLRDLERVLRTARRPDEGIAFQRIARVYSEYRHGRKTVPTLFLVKPDQARHWTASAAMRDADDAFNEIMFWDGQSGGKSKTEGP